MKRWGVLVTVMGAVCAVAATVSAQTGAVLDPVEPKPQPEAAVVSRVVAGSRATLATHPSRPVVAEGEANESCCRTIGAAHNFPREDGTMLMRFGSVLKLKLSDQIEGVWYEEACGWLGTLLIVDAHVTDGSGNKRWVEIGRDGAAGYRCGPSIGTARDIHVRFRPPRPGFYELRSRIYTYALPRVNDSEKPTRSRCSDVAVSEVLTKVLAVRYPRPIAGPRDVEPVEEMPRADLDDIIE